MTNKIEEKIDLLLKGKNRREIVEVPTNLLRKVKTKFHKDNHEKYYYVANIIGREDLINQYKLVLYMFLNFMNDNKDKKLAKRFFKTFGTMKKNLKMYELEDSPYVQQFIESLKFYDFLDSKGLLYGQIEGKDLKLVLTYHWFDEIEAGRKLVEYREAKAFYKKLETENYTTVTFYRGYGKDRKEMRFEIKSIDKMNGKDTDLHIDKEVYAINLGERLW